MKKKSSRFWLGWGLILFASIFFAFGFYLQFSKTIVLDFKVAELEQHLDPISSSMPRRIKIPSIQIDTEFEAPLGVNEDNTVEVPKDFTKVGWYKYGPTPGELGPAVILGHVDSRDGPAIFFSLGQLTLGDEVEIERDDGSLAKFLVTGLERYEQEDFPTSKVYGDVDYAGLRLVTCSGYYDKGELKYSHNLVVYAELNG